jgi:hypothetical protein
MTRLKLTLVFFLDFKGSFAISLFFKMEKTDNPLHVHFLRGMIVI